MTFLGEDMKYKIKNKNIIIKSNNDFNPKHIFECGQAFRWEREEDNSYTCVAKGRVINIFQSNDEIVFSNTNEEDFNNIWIDYFDLKQTIII